MELQRLKNIVYNQHNISLKVRARTYKKAIYSIATKKTYTQLLLQKQYNRGNFFEVHFIPGISHAKNISRLTTTSTSQEKVKGFKMVHRWLIKVSHHVEGGGCYRMRLLSWKRVKIKKCVSVLQNDGVKKLVGPMHILKRPTHFFSSTHYT